MSKILEGVDALDSTLLGPYRDDPASMKAIDGFLTMLPDDRSRVLALRTLSKANISYDDPMTVIFIGVVALNARLMSSQLQVIFADGQALHDRASELRNALADLTKTVGGVTGEASAMRGEIAEIRTSVGKQIDSLRGDLQTRVNLASDTIRDASEEIKEAAIDLTEHREETKRQGEAVAAATRELATMLAGMAPTIIEPLHAKLSATLNARLDKLLADMGTAAREIALAQVEEELGNTLPKLQVRVAALDTLVTTTLENLRVRLGSLDTSAIKLPPYINAYIDLSNTPKWLVVGAACTAFVTLVLGFMAGIRFHV